MGEVPEARMEDGTGFARQWFTWRRTPAPVEGYRTGRRGTPADDVECDIDHLVSAVLSLGAGYMEGRDWEYSGLAAECLEDVACIDQDLDAVDLPEAEKAVYRRYLAATRSVLETIGRGR